MDLAIKHRPTKFAEVLGQPTAIKTLQNFLKQDQMPHCLLFSGASGCGKTTLARIVASELGCNERNLIEINTADFRGIDTVREIRSLMYLSPIGGQVRIWILDECHTMRSDAQTALLKILEEPPSHVYFCLVTTEPGKLLKTIRTRCTAIQVQSLKTATLQKLVVVTAAKEKRKLPESVIKKIVQQSEGSARKAITALHRALRSESEAEQLEFLTETEVSEGAIALARALFARQISWQAIARILTELTDDPEQVRYLVLSYANSILLKGGPLSDRAFYVIRSFKEPFFYAGKAALSGSCYEIFAKSSPSKR